MLESKYLKDNIQNIQKLMSIPALKHFETRNLAKILRLSKIREYDDGEVIIKEGDVDPWLYFLLTGRVIIKKRGIEITQINSIGEIFGEMRIIDDEGRSADVYADGHTICLAVNTSAHKHYPSGTSTDKEETLDFILLLYRIFAEYMSARLRLTNTELIKAKMEAGKLRKKLQGK
ncbi:cyclic nucleotide-binding domain-containing protein [Desulfosudis oleivorans]|uniref:Cyclic nucleotide-binding protein n=1 Tax=Desulfosudis oleivorans (strain DSM 6200 / JCM 39069 / Hxd3) TaxID=96561 RepID=A8ZXT6_DESOH|nr:cyclic nucleotide-binding domain-containing protein [Desulfosudis oleivorans]ABW68563.1 cyclic nucleotide-binding protein [Desulfosudis oleivorans Hxd3]